MVWHKCAWKASLLRSIKDTRKKHNRKYNRLVIQLAVWTVVFHKTISAWNGLYFAEAPSLAVLI